MATINAMASKLSGVAPLSVFFDVIQVVGITEPPLVGGRREYADFDYEWDFDDPSAGTWAISGKSKNTDNGYCTAHVFETAGTYTVTVNVTDGSTVNESHDVTITVSDPDTYYSGTDTVCVSTSGDFTGCPSGATQLTTSDLDVVSPYFGVNRRILFRRGESWTTANSYALANDNGMTIGAYGNCSTPNDRGICSNAPVFNLNGGGSGGLFDTSNVSNIRIMDLNLVGVARDGAVGGNQGMYEQLHLRLQASSFSSTAFGNGRDNSPDQDQLTYADCEVTESSANNIFIGCERLVLMGNHVTDPDVSHVCRVWQAYKGVISHNQFSGSSILSDTGRHALKFHGPTESDVGAGGVGGINNRTRWVCIKHNIFGTSGPWPVTIGPPDELTEVLVEDIHFDSNRLYAGYGTPSTLSLDVQVPVNIWSQNTTVSNNVISGQGSSKYFTGIKVEDKGISQAPLNCRLYNNTIYKNDAPEGGDAYVGIEIGTATDTIVKNNFVLFNESIGVRTLISDGGTNTDQSNNLLDAPTELVDPDNVDWLSKDFKLISTSNGIDAGTSVPVLIDADGNSRQSGIAIDLGAYEWHASAPATTPVGIRSSIWM